MSDLGIIYHIKELRTRILVSSFFIAVAACFTFNFYAEILNLITAPLKGLNLETTLYSYTLIEGFVVKLKLSLMAAVIATLPVHIINCLGFIFPGLRKKEKRYLLF